MTRLIAFTRSKEVLRDGANSSLSVIYLSTSCGKYLIRYRHKLACRSSK